MENVAKRRFRKKYNHFPIEPVARKTLSLRSTSQRGQLATPSGEAKAQPQRA
jgi:TATA-binding protein-associated factor Taf7